MKKIKLAILFGGASGEHDVSINSAKSIFTHINTEKYEIIPVYISKVGDFLLVKDINSLENGEKITLSTNKSDKCFYIIKTFEKINIDCIFPIMHGQNAEDGTLQGLFDICNIPYVGCNLSASANSMDKSITKIIVEKCNILQAKHIVCTEIIKNPLPYPVFIKPSSSGSSIGVSMAKNDLEFKKGMENALKVDTKVIVEEFIDAREIEIAILGNNDIITSVAGEIISNDEFYSFDAKYINNTSFCNIPADLPQDISQKIMENAKQIYKALGCTGLSRIDFFVNPNYEIYFNEINTMPGFTDISMYPKLINYMGIEYSDLIDRLVQLAMERYHG